MRATHRWRRKCPREGMMKKPCALVDCISIRVAAAAAAAAAAAGECYVFTFSIFMAPGRPIASKRSSFQSLAAALCSELASCFVETEVCAQIYLRLSFPSPRYHVRFHRRCEGAPGEGAASPQEHFETKNGPFFSPHCFLYKSIQSSPVRLAHHRRLH